MHEMVVRTRVGAMTYLAPPSALNDDGALAHLQSAATACLAAHDINLVLDLVKVSVLNSKALEVMLGLQTKLTSRGGRLKVANPNALVKEIFLATGFADFVEIIEAEDGSAIHSRRAAPSLAKRPLGDILLAKGLLNAAQINEVAELQRQQGKRMGQILLQKNWVSEIELLKALAEQMGIPYVALRPGLYDPAVLQLLGKEIARRLLVLPMFNVNGVLTLATTDPQSIPSFDEIERLTGCRVRLVLSRGEDILKNLLEAYSGTNYDPQYVDALSDDLELIENQIPDDYTQIDEMAADSPVISLVNAIIQRAIRDGASDIHLEISRTKSRVRFRIDGILYEIMTPRVELHPALVSRLKVMANLDIAERRLPQDGRIQVATQGRTVDLRFSSLPGIFGEKIVLRVLDKNNAILDVNKLGMNSDALMRFKKLLGRSHGLILATGPTGSGKTTTLYAAINHLKSMEKNIVTIEDPVEYQIDIINQNQVSDAIGLTFPKMLKHVLRQDPDIIMVGEIRDRQTAEIAVQGALTGHLVLSTLHTNDSVGAVARLIEMGVEPYLLSSALIGVVAQRLVRQVCSECKTSYLASPDVVTRYGWNPADNIRLVKGRGCRTCYDSGYKGRLGIHELLETDAGLERLINTSASRDKLSEYVLRHGFRTLFQDGLSHVLQGDTTLEEISRAVSE